MENDKYDMSKRKKMVPMSRKKGVIRRIRR